MPFQERIAKVLRGRRTLSASLLCVGFLIVILVPVSFLGVSVVKQMIAMVQSGIQAVRDGELDRLAERAPTFAQKPIAFAVERLELSRDQLSERAGAIGARGVAMLAAILGGVGTALTNIVLMLIALMVFLVEGPSIATWLRETLPLNRGHTTEFVTEFHKVSQSVVVANIGTSLAQALAALVGFLITGTPNVLVATTLTFFLSFVPAVGAASTVLAAAAFMFATGHPVKGVVLLVWAVTVVGLIDNVLKPVFMKRGVEMNGALLFFAIISGIAAFGASGFVIGPLIAAFSLTLVRIYRRDFRPETFESLDE